MNEIDSDKTVNFIHFLFVFECPDQSNAIKSKPRITEQKIRNETKQRQHLKTPKLTQTRREGSVIQFISSDDL